MHGRTVSSTQISPADLHRQLVREKVSDRVAAAIGLCNQLLAAGQTDDALNMLELAWRLGLHEPAVLRPLVQMLCDRGRARDALDRCREAALTLLERGDLRGVFEAVALGTDRAADCHLPMDDNILFRSLQRALAPNAFPQRTIRSAPPFRIGYVMVGDNNPHCLLPRLFLLIAERHDRALFEPVFFSLYSERELPWDDPNAPLNKIAACGFPIICNDYHGSDRVERAFRLAQRIADLEVDLVIFQGQTPDYFVAAALRPAPLILGFDHGNPHGYISPCLDYALSAVDRFCIEHRADSIYFPKTAFLLDHDRDAPALSREELGLPSDCLWLLSSGFKGKFDPRVKECADFFRTMSQILARNPKACWTVLGVTASEVPHLIECLDHSVRSQVRFVGLVPNVTPYLKGCDICVDTYPISGGLTIYEALLLGVPTFTYCFYYDGFFDKLKAYSMMGDFMRGSALVLEDNSLSTFEARLERMIREPEFRMQNVTEGRRIALQLADIKGFVEEIERELLRVIEHRAQPVANGSITVQSVESMQGDWR